MLKVLGSAKRLCDGIDRREMLRAGSLGLFSAGLASLNPRIAQAGEASDNPTFGKAKRVILLFARNGVRRADPDDLFFGLVPDFPDRRFVFRKLRTITLDVALHIRACIQRDGFANFLAKPLDELITNMYIKYLLRKHLYRELWNIFPHSLLVLFWASA